MMRWEEGKKEYEMIIEADREAGEHKEERGQQDYVKGRTWIAELN